LIGDGYLDYLVDLWIGVALHRPDGKLHGWDAGDIADEAGWEGNVDVFAQSLKEAGFLDWNGEYYKCHDWEKHQTWACRAEERSLSATKNQMYRWCVAALSNKKDKDKFKEWYYGKLHFTKGLNTDTILNEYEAYTNPNTPILSPPIPSSPNQQTIKASDETSVLDAEQLKEGSEKLISESIKALCDELKKKKIFPTVYAFVGKMKKSGKNDRAISHTLVRCLAKKNFDSTPWAYCQKIIEVEDGNYNESDHTRNN
jgi:hypothetical protein